MIVKKWLMSSISLLLLVGMITTANSEEIRDYYAEPGLNPFKETLNDLNESIDPFSGTLQQKYVDLKIPGNGGLDIVLNRFYTSQQEAGIAYRGFTGVGWTMHFGRIVVPTAHEDKICNQSLWSVSTRDNPSIEFPDGGRELLVLMPGGGTGGAETLITKTNWKAECQTTGGMKVTAPDGKIYYMDEAEVSTSDSGNNFTWYTSRIEDLDGNWMDISYDHSMGIKHLKKIEASDGRVVDFDYLDEGLSSVRLWKIKTASQTITYDYEPLVDHVNQFQLTQVTRPDGLTWKYTYYGPLGVGEGGDYSMKSVEYPHGGKSEYSYQLIDFDMSTPGPLTTSIKTKKTSGPSITPGTWTYTFTPSSGLNVPDVTEVVSPSSRTVYSHQGYNTGGTLVWPVGLLVAKDLYAPDGTLIYVEQNTWDKRLLSNENYWHGRDKVDTNYYVPVRTKTEYWRNGDMLATTYSNHDGFGNPQTIEEDCVVDGCDPRVTDITYLNDTDNWLIGLPLVKTIKDVGTITHTYHANGRLKSVDKFGVLTQYRYTAAGDLSEETDARNFSKTYSSYHRGIAQHERHQVDAGHYIETRRVINNTGTVAEQTDGLGHTKRFTYDAMNRLKSITFPLHDGVDITYAKGGKTLIRGAYQEAATLDGFGKPIQLERTDLHTGTTVAVTTAYDALGRTIFTSYPNATLGVTTTYDALDRPLSITKGDGSSRQYAYDIFLDTGGHYYGDTKLTDERGKVTYSFSHYYGSYAESLGVVNVITEETYTATLRNALGQPIEITQGVYDEDGSVYDAYVRAYAYDTRGFLVQETNPETGVTQYGRDAVGNMTSSQVGTSGVTSYTYDGLNRLVTTDYPAGTDDISLAYDDNSNLVQSTKGDIVWHYGYDANDNLTSEQLTLNRVPARDFAIGYQYDSLDNLSTMTYPNSLSVDFTPDALGHPTKAGSFMDTVSYHPNGLLAHGAYANGVDLTHGINSLQQLSHIHAAAASDVVDLGYYYDPSANLSAITDAIDPANDIGLVYDANDRMTEATGAWGTEKLTYSPHGNILTKAEASYTYSGGKLFRITYDTLPGIISRLDVNHDVYGNVSSRQRLVYDTSAASYLFQQTRSFTYDDASNLIEADNDLTAGVDRTYQYDANNQRVVQKIDGKERLSVYNKAGSLIYEADEASCEDTAYVYLGSALIAKKIKASTYDGDADGKVDCALAGGDATPPVVTPPADLVIEATAVLTPVSLGTATALDDVDGSLTATPDKSGPFALGVHTITWSATDAGGNTGTATQTVTLQDTTPPVLSVPADITETSGVPIAVTLGSATATDLFAPVTITNDAPALFPLGDTRVTWTATDANGNQTTAIQTVTVGGDSIAPVITAPGDIVMEATAVLTPVSLGTATALDNVDGSLIATPDDSGPFALGVHTITWSATDAAGNTGTATQKLTIQDTTAPVLKIPNDISQTSSSEPQVINIGAATATDLFEPVSVTNDAPAQYPYGTTQVTWTATDANGNQSTAIQTVTLNKLDWNSMTPVQKLIYLIRLWLQSLYR